jgi:tol-pal system protein YbgF
MTTSGFHKGVFASWLMVSCLVLLVSSCVTSQQDVMYLNDQVAALNTKVRQLEESVEPMRERQADLGAEMDGLRSNMQRLSGEVEDHTQLVQRVIDKDTTQQDMMRATVTELSARVAVLETELKRVYEYLGLETRIGRVEPDTTLPPGAERAAAPAGTPSPTSPTPAVSPPAAAPAPGLSPEKALYDASLTKYRDGNYEEAIAGFKAFLNRYPKSELADNAQFWIGECHMGLKQYEQAILAYQEVIQKYGKGNKVANAMLRQAIAFYEINDKTSAKLLLEKVVKQYPDSNEAKIAKTKLQTMK